MKFTTSILILTLLFLNFQIAAASENEYGIVKAWLNGENATVNGLQLKIGQPVEVKVKVSSKIDGHVGILLTEPGGTKGFELLSGPSKEDETLQNLNIVNGWSETYTWKLTPNGKWKNGNAPINIVVQFYNIKKDYSKTIQFTIANPYILDEQYTGATTTTTPAPEITGTSAPPAKATPFLPIIFTVSVLLLAWRLGKEKS
ncbi:MAG: sarcinarray family MAST domain-containing protein [Candidatus Methanoperedens sp.]